MATATLLHFDDFQFQLQFDHKRAVTKDSHITYADFERMHTLRRRMPSRREPTPEWALNDELLREVVVSYVERRCYLFNDAPHLKPMAERLQAIKEEAARRKKQKLRDLHASIKLNRRGIVKDSQVQNFDTQIVLLNRAPITVVLAAAYYYYRLGWKSNQVAMELGLRAPHIRIMMWRLNHIAQWIAAGRPDGFMKKWSDSNRWAKRKRWQTVSGCWNTIVRLRNDGKTWPQVLEYFGTVDPETKVRMLEAAVQRAELEWARAVKKKRARQPSPGP